ncbi:helix-turn-helix domain-containing protein [Paenibacillus sp. HW567]|uniref:helix-turn-helix domain-containing protein n=1 Tax=Paenibacillus sp. HW567 TaxID=1034769 RepID=UPI000362BB7C|nr:helix-turn-helix domain-containing protein [Paenibacillus sp. HW567]
MANKQTDYAIHGERPYGILIAGHYAEEPGYSIHRPSGSVDWLLMYTLSGEGEIQRPEGTVTCGPGDLAVLLPGMPHHYGTRGSRWEFIWVHFIPDPQWLTWLKLPLMSELFAYKHLPAGELRSNVEDGLVRMALNDLPAGRSELHRKLSELALEEALIHLQLHCNTEYHSSMDPRVAEILQHLQQFPAAKISIPELAKRSCLSPSRLSHLFKEQVGDTILNTVCKFRLERAAQLLSGTTRQVAEIASDVGYDCSIHFTRKFREAFGETPSGYRKRKNQVT